MASADFYRLHVGSFSHQAFSRRFRVAQHARARIQPTMLPPMRNGGGRVVRLHQFSFPNYEFGGLLLTVVAAIGLGIRCWALKIALSSKQTLCFFFGRWIEQTHECASGRAWRLNLLRPGPVSSNSLPAPSRKPQTAPVSCGGILLIIRRSRREGWERSHGLYACCSFRARLRIAPAMMADIAHRRRSSTCGTSLFQGPGLLARSARQMPHQLFGTSVPGFEAWSSPTVDISNWEEPM